MANALYRNLRAPDGSTIDIEVRAGLIASLAPAVPATGAVAGEEIVDGKGQLVLPALVEAHVHLDKTMWGMALRPNTAGPNLKDFIANERSVLRDVETPIQKRAGALLERLIACGSLHVRSHVDVDPEIGLSHVEAMLALRETYRQFVDLQLVAFPQQGMLIRPGTAELMERAIEMGVEVVGGIDPAGIDGDPMAQLRTIFDIAARHGRGIDIHLHDQGELGAWEVERIADFTAASGLKGKVMVSHAYCLGSVPEGRAGAIGERLAELGISLMTTAPADTPSPPVARLRALGVNVCCGSDGIRDAWSPFGTGDMLQRAMLLCQRFDWVREDEIAAAFDCASAAGAKALGIERYGLALGNEANFVMVGAECLTDAIASQPPNRTVVRQGRVVAAGKPLSGGT